MNSRPMFLLLIDEQRNYNFLVMHWTATKPILKEMQQILLLTAVRELQ